jgi:hypothetical protein
MIWVESGRCNSWGFPFFLDWFLIASEILISIDGGFFVILGLRLILGSFMLLILIDQEHGACWLFKLASENLVKNHWIVLLSRGGHDRWILSHPLWLILSNLLDVPFSVFDYRKFILLYCLENPSQFFFCFVNIPKILNCCISVDWVCPFLSVISTRVWRWLILLAFLFRATQSLRDLLITQSFISLVSVITVLIFPQNITSCYASTFGALHWFSHFRQKLSWLVLLDPYRIVSIRPTNTLHWLIISSVLSTLLLLVCSQLLSWTATKHVVIVQRMSFRSCQTSLVTLQTWKHIACPDGNRLSQLDLILLRILYICHWTNTTYIVKILLCS